MSANRPVESFLAAACGPGARDPEPAASLFSGHRDELAQDLAASIAAGMNDALRSHLEGAGGEIVNRKLSPLGWPPILYACRSTLAHRGSPHADALAETVRLLLQAGADPAACFPGRSDGEVTLHPPALYAAAGLNGNAAMTQALLGAGAGVEFGETLIECAFRDAWDCFDALLAAGADIDRTAGLDGFPPLHAVIDRAADPARIRHLFNRGADPDRSAGHVDETPLLVAVRRRRLEVVKDLLDLGVDIDAKTAGGKTGFAHAARRGFREIESYLGHAGADRTLTPADQLAVALSASDLDRAKAIVAEHPEAAKSRSPEESRISADLAGRPAPKLLEWLLDAGGDTEARGLDGGTPVQQAAWFGQPECAKLLIDRGADLTVRCTAHGSNPVGWVAHGSLWSGDAEQRMNAYVEIAEALVKAGAPVPPDVPAADAVLKIIRPG